MKHHHLLFSLLLLSTITLIALLIVRFTPEEGQAAGYSPPSLNYTALGDSITWGAGVTQQQRFANLYQNYLGTDLNTTTTLDNKGIVALFSSELANKLQTDQSFRTSVTNAHVVTIFIGINDYNAGHSWYLDPNSPYCLPKETCMQQIVDGFKNYWDQIIAEIKSLNSGITIRALTIFNPHVTQDQANGNFDYFKNYLEQMNNHITDSAGPNNYLVADIYHLFNGPNGDIQGSSSGYFNSNDVLHPNANGHQLIANYLRGIGYSGLDQDNDQVADPTDNCPGVANTDQANLNKEPMDLTTQYPYDDVTNTVGDNIGDACDPDRDHDWLPDSEEVATQVNNPDSDGDNFLDGAEARCGSNPTDAASTPKKPYPTMPSYTAPDSDNDGLPNSCEASFGSNPSLKDTDGDKLADGIEALYLGSNPASSDSDGDTCADGVEAASLNSDKSVNSADQLLIAQTFNKRVGQIGYVRSFDINGDGVINSGDQVIQAGVFNQRCS